MSFAAVAYSRLWRVVAAVLIAISRGSLLLMAFAVAFLETTLENPLRLVRTFVVASVAPGLGAWFLARAFAASVEVRDGVLAIVRRHERVEIPCSAIVAFEWWRVPLPSPGFALRLRSGRRVACDVALADPAASSTVLDEVVRAGGPDVPRAEARTSSAVYATSCRAASRWWVPLVRYPLFALVPTVPLFRLHQWVTYGGTFGEYYVYGLRAYLLGFVIYWATLAIWLVLWAAVVRAAAEAIVAVTARLAPARIAGVRHSVERLALIAYVAGVPLFLLRVAVLAS